MTVAASHSNFACCECVPRMPGSSSRPRTKGTTAMRARTRSNRGPKEKKQRQAATASCRQAADSGTFDDMQINASHAAVATRASVAGKVRDATVITRALRPVHTTTVAAMRRNIARSPHHQAHSEFARAARCDHELAVEDVHELCQTGWRRNRPDENARYDRINALADTPSARAHRD